MASKTARPSASDEIWTMKILIHHDKHGDNIWSASTPEKEEAAFLAMFNLLDNKGGKYTYYRDILDNVQDKRKEVAELQTMQQDLVGSKLSDTSKEFITNQISSLPTKKGQLKQAENIATLYNKAQSGDAKAAKLLISLRKDCEYEGWNFEEAVDPLI